MASMSEQSAPEFPRGDMFLDARGAGRAMRLSWHPDADIVVLSLWRESTCAGTFRMPQSEVGAFIDALVDGLRDAPGVHLPPQSASQSAPEAPAETGVESSQPAFADWAFGGPERSGAAPTESDGRAAAS